MFLTDIYCSLKLNARAPDFSRRVGRMVAWTLRDLYYTGRVLSSPSHAPAGFTFREAERTQAGGYEILEELVPHFKLAPDEVMVDLGCGLGRTVWWWNHLGLKNRMIGIELNAAIASRAARLFRKRSNVEIRCGDATLDLPSDGTFFYLFGTLGPEALKRFEKNFRETVGKNPRARLFYVYSRNQHVFPDSLWSKTAFPLKSHPDWPPVMVLTPR